MSTGIIYGTGTVPSTHLWILFVNVLRYYARSTSTVRNLDQELFKKKKISFHGSEINTLLFVFSSNIFTGTSTALQIYGNLLLRVLYYTVPVQYYRSQNYD